jgi:hypothetical protein
MKKTIDFDINQIVKITFRPSFHNTRYEWREKTIIPKYRGFLWFKKMVGYEETREGFYDLYAFYDSGKVISEKQIHDGENMVKFIGDIGSTHGVNQVWFKASVQVILSNQSIINRIFTSDTDAKYWITNLKQMTNKIFETI